MLIWCILHHHLYMLRKQDLKHSLQWLENIIKPVVHSYSSGCDSQVFKGI